MALTYTWNIKRLRVLPQDTNLIGDVFIKPVTNVYWEKTGTDSDGYSGTFAGATGLSYSAKTPEEFTAFEDLTEEMVLNWVKLDTADTEYETHINGIIQLQINTEKEAAEDTSLPWVTIDSA